MKKRFLLFVLSGAFFVVSNGVFAATAPQNWDKFEKYVRDSCIEKPQAMAFAKVMRPLLDSYYTDMGCKVTSCVFVFPLE